MRLKATAQAEAKKTQAKGVLAREAVALDYPQEGETVIGPDYTFRISATDKAQSVEVCLDQGDWQPCREAVGYWWSDCAGIQPGQHQIRARATDRDGNVKMTMLRLFQAQPA